MIDLRPFVASAVLAGILMAPALAPAQTANPAPPSPAASALPMKTIGVPSKRKGSESLIVLNASGAKLVGQTLVLDGTAPSAILFTDRPARGAGHIALREVVDLWSSGSFAKDPPNATVSAFAKDGSAVSDAVVVLTKPRFEGDKLTFDVAVLEGDLGKSDGPAAIFIDTIWFGVGSGGVSYLGQNQTTAGTSANIGSRDDTSTYSGWSNPAPDGAARRRSYDSGYDAGLATPPYAGIRPNSPQCGAPPLLPCY
jgi:hypothetical protein